MAKRDGSKVSSRRHRKISISLSPSSCKLLGDMQAKKKRSNLYKKKEWDDATCPVCMEHPHNAVLLLCASYNKGCRPYMCATSHRYSNCLEQYKKAYTKVTEIPSSSQQVGLVDDLDSGSGKMEMSELLCPLCRGQVKGWTVVESARKYFNNKKRTCMQDNCSFAGNYKELRKHVRAEHPLARPRAVDPALEEKWKRLEHERERNDVISTVVSSTPGAVVLGDYVIEPGHLSFYRDYGMNDHLNSIFSLNAFDLGQSSAYSSRYHRYFDSLDDEDFGRPATTGFLVPGRNLHRILLGRSRRRRRHREGGGGR